MTITVATTIFFITNIIIKLRDKLNGRTRQLFATVFSRINIVD